MIKVHKEGISIILKSIIGITLIVVGILIFSNYQEVIYGSIITALLLVLLIIRFFRVPKREARFEDGFVMAPADGTIVEIKETYEGEFLKTNVIQVSIFMSVFNVHINWFPIKGRVSYYKYHPGDYLVAMHPKSSEKNERTSVVIESEKGVNILIRQIAGLLARRIVCYAEEGKDINQNQELGFIKFGSRVDLFLPIETRVQVTKGQKVKGTQTIIAKLS